MLGTIIISGCNSWGLPRVCKAVVCWSILPHLRPLLAMSTTDWRLNGGGSNFSHISQRGRNESKCNCNHMAVIRVSRTEKNPGRLFFACPKLKVADTCDFFKWVENEFVAQEIASQSTSTMGLSGSDDEVWKKNVSRTLKRLENQNRRVNWTLMVSCIVIGFLLGLLWKN